MRHWASWVILVLVLINAGWMTFDGSRALIVGDYVTPKSGKHAGQLGPWSALVGAVGIAPRSTLMKSIFVLYGLAYLGTMLAFLLQLPGSQKAMLLMAVLGLWYLPFGTLINLIVIALLWIER